MRSLLSQRQGWCCQATNGVGAGFAGSNPDDAFDKRHEYFSIANVARLTAFANDLNRLFGVFVGQDEFDDDLGQDRSLLRSGRG